MNEQSTGQNIKQTTQISGIGIWYRQQWQMNKTVISLALADTGVIQSMLNQSLANINWLPRLSQAQEVVVINTCSIIKKFHSDHVPYLMQGPLTPNDVSSPCSGCMYLFQYSFMQSPADNRLKTRTLGCQTPDIAWD
jgi:hypothetical protein